MDYTIDGFWKARLSAIEKIQHFAPRPGWSDANARLEAFEEAGLSLRPDYTDLTQPVWLIAAPGAVGKSTLAQQLCAATGAIYLDLAVADTVGGHYITGGLVHTNALAAWQTGQTTLVIDALDEARLRVTQQAFEDFLQYHNNRGQTTVSHFKRTLSFSRGAGFFLLKRPNRSAGSRWAMALTFTLVSPTKKRS